VIGTNKADANDTIDRLLEDLPTLTPAPQPDPTAIETLLQTRSLTYVTIEDWRVLDKIETVLGTNAGRPRVKLTSIQAMLEAITAAKQVNVPG
jgi:ferredoxin--NADP+ reductase